MTKPSRIIDVHVTRDLRVAMIVTFRSYKFKCEFRLGRRPDD